MANGFGCGALKVRVRVTQGLPEDCAACRCSATALIDGNSLHAGLCLLSLCTPAIKVNILISGPSAANHILTFKRRFKTSGKVKEKKSMKLITENYAATSKNEAGGICNGPPPLELPPAWKGDGNGCIQSGGPSLGLFAFPPSDCSL